MCAIILSDDVKATGAAFDRCPAWEAGQGCRGALYVNTIAAGILWGLLDGRKETIEGVISRFFGGKTPEVINRNLTAVGSGMEFGRELQCSGQVSLVLPPPGKGPAGSPSYRNRSRCPGGYGRRLYL